MSLEKTVAKALINCAAAEAIGSNCASAALGTLVTEIAVASGVTAETPEEFRAKLTLIAAVAGWVASGGDPDNLNATVDAAMRDVDNNIRPALIAVFVIGLTAADYALSGYDAYQLTKAGLACDAGDTTACAEAAQMVKDFALETGVTLTGGAFVPGTKIGMKIMGALRKSGNDEVIDAVDRAAEQYPEGPHRDTSRPAGDGLDSHHCPAKKCYEGAPISTADGPAIKMDANDHKRTRSYGSGEEAQEFRARQKALLLEGKLMEAIQMDIDDIRSIAGSKYDKAIAEMLDYARTLDPQDFISK
ncbi:hypothetical protein C7U60_03795 [Mesorhizobium plurifarium]|uniref:hypothetical protein n=1 Tax=Sinorhizobium arboris TaxID=76745 RepID=UPI000400DD09|nr:hypothetical protein [Sinorhizobium arboris]PST26168.1 hypothetical protein C7U60_03795 [Mesorhizobium plurifarium]